MLQVVALVVRDDEGPVDDAGAQVPHGLVTGIGRRDEQVQQVVALVEPTGDALHDRREVGVAEEARVSSGTTSAIAPVVRLASDRAARFGT